VDRLAAEAPGAARASYDALVAFARALDEPSSWAATGCEGWAVRDLLIHWLGDTRRALVALHTPSADSADRDAASYWTDWGRNLEGAANGRRFARVMASMFLDLSQLVEVVTETAGAVVHATHVLPLDQHVRTQGHVLRTDHLLGTVAVEATIHHLDAIVALPDLPPPSARGVAYTRAVLDTLLGRPAPPEWDDARYLRIVTGRAGLTDDERRAFGDDAARLPLLC
jgi:hypothetical protein